MTTWKKILIFNMLSCDWFGAALLPVYNEAFVFDVPIDRLSDVSLLVRVLDSSAGEASRLGAQTIGKCIVGPDAHTSIGLHHWNCMMTTPRKPIAQWHPLVKTWRIYLSPHVRLFGFQNPGKSRILGFGTQNSAQGIPNPTNNRWNPESKFHSQGIWNPVPN